MDCNSYAKQLDKPADCVVDLKFKYTVVKTSLGCVDIKMASGLAGPLGTATLAFEDYIECAEREMCRGDSWTIPDRRSSVNICELAVLPNNPWDLKLTVEDTRDRSISFPSVYKWDEFKIPIAPTPTAPTPTAPTPTAPTPTVGPPSSCGVLCEDRPDKMKFSVVPAKCSESQNSFTSRILKTSSGNSKYSKNGNKDKNYFTCQGNMPSFPINYQIMNKYGNVLTEGTAYSSGDVFYFSPVPSNVIVKFVSNSGGEQLIGFHSSCSKDLYTCNTFGSLKIVDFVY